MRQKEVDFINELMLIESAYILCLWKEHSNTKYKAQRKKIQNYFHKITPFTFRVTEPLPSWWERGEKVLNTYMKKKVFKIHEYKHDNLGVLYLYYLSNDNIYHHNEYFSGYLAINVKGKLKVITELCWNQLITSDPKALVYKQSAFDRKAWKTIGGEEMKSFGTLTKVIRIEPPQNEFQLKEYLRDYSFNALRR